MLRLWLQATLPSYALTRRPGKRDLKTALLGLEERSFGT